MHSGRPGIIQRGLSGVAIAGYRLWRGVLSRPALLVLGQTALVALVVAAMVAIGAGT